MILLGIHVIFDFSHVIIETVNSSAVAVTNYKSYLLCTEKLSMIFKSESVSLLVISEIWLIQIDKKRLLQNSQISVKISWFNSKKYFSLITSVKINWINSKKYFFTDYLSKN